MTAPTHPLRGIALLMAALLCFVLLDSTSKHLAATWPVSMVVWARYAVHWLLMTALLTPRYGRALIATRRPLLQVLRACTLLATSWFIVAALQRLPLAETTAILFIAPLLVTLLARFTLHEAVSPLRWAAVAVGFAGALAVTRPGGGTLAAGGVVLALCAACTFALYQILTRVLSATERPLAQLYYTALVGTAGMSLVLPWQWGGPAPGTADLLMFAAMGVFGGTGHFLLIRAFREAPASVLSPVLYLQLAWATLLGWLAFDQLPDAGAFAGIVVIGVAGAMTAFDGARRSTGGVDRPNEQTRMP